MLKKGLLSLIACGTLVSGLSATECTFVKGTVSGIVTIHSTDCAVTDSNNNMDSAFFIYLSGSNIEAYIESSLEGFSPAISNPTNIGTLAVDENSNNIFTIKKEESCSSSYPDGSTYTPLPAESSAHYCAYFKLTDGNMIAIETTLNSSATFDTYGQGGLDIPPTATDVVIQVSDSNVTDADPNTELTANYTYADDDGDTESGTTFQWYSADTSSGTFSAINSATSSTFTPDTTLESKYIKVGVTPVNANTSGLESNSSAITINDITAPTITSSSASGGVASISSLKLYTDNATLDTTSKAYYLVVPANSTAPTKTQVKAGVNYGDVNITKAGELTHNNVGDPLYFSKYNITGMPDKGASYDVYFVEVDSSGNISDVDNTTFTTQTADTTPEDVNFTSKTDQELNTPIESNEVTITGINTDASVSVDNTSACEFKIDSANWGIGSSIANNGKLKLRINSSTNYGDEINCSVTVGGSDFNYSVTTKKAEITGLIANKWNMVSVGNGKIGDLSSVDSTKYNASIWGFENDTWKEKPTSASPQIGFWVKPIGTSIKFNAEANTTKDLADTTAIKTAYTKLSKGWNLVGFPIQRNWSDVIRSDNLTPSNCAMYSEIYYYDSTNNSWNTSTNIPANSGAWLIHHCKPIVDNP